MTARPGIFLRILLGKRGPSGLDFSQGTPEPFRRIGERIAVALRVATRFCLIGLLAVAGAFWLAVPKASAAAAYDGWARVALEPASSSLQADIVKRIADPESALANLLRMPWSGEDDDSPRALASSFDDMPLRGADTFSVDAGGWLSQASPFLIPFKTGPPLSDS